MRRRQKRTIIGQAYYLRERMRSQRVLRCTALEGLGDRL
jgi:hypothetical protein